MGPAQCWTSFERQVGLLGAGQLFALPPTAPVSPRVSRFVRIVDELYLGCTYTIPIFLLATDPESKSGRLLRMPVFEDGTLTASGCPAGHGRGEGGQSNDPKLGPRVVSTGRPITPKN